MPVNEFNDRSHFKLRKRFLKQVRSFLFLEQGFEFENTITKPHEQTRICLESFRVFRGSCFRLLAAYAAVRNPGRLACLRSGPRVS